jgi:hypothetical protein
MDHTDAFFETTDRWKVDSFYFNNSLPIINEVTDTVNEDPDFKNTCVWSTQIYELLLAYIY